MPADSARQPISHVQLRIRSRRTAPLELPHLPRDRVPHLAQTRNAGPSCEVVRRVSSGNTKVCVHLCIGDFLGHHQQAQQKVIAIDDQLPKRVNFRDILLVRALDVLRDYVGDNLGQCVTRNPSLCL